MAHTPAQKLEYDRTWRANNRERHRGYGRKYRASEKGRAYFRKYHLKRKYGLTPEQWDAMFQAQGCACACCGGDDPSHRLGWQVDHNHDTNKVRAILCFPCNRDLAVAENKALLRRLERYLERYDQ